MPVEWKTLTTDGSGNVIYGNTSTASSNTFWGNNHIKIVPSDSSGSVIYGNTWAQPFEEAEPDETPLWDQI